MRYQQIYRVEFKQLQVLMASIQDGWATDDMVIGDMSQEKYHEEEAVTWWLAMLNCAKSGDVVIDAGAYSGLYSLLAAKCRPDIRCIAIEASSITFGRLVNNILLNSFDSLINPNHVALTTKREVVSLGHAFGVLSMSSGESLQPTYETDYSELVAGVTLDSLLIQDDGQSFGPISSKSSAILPIANIAGMKVDLEGVEIEVLKHGGNVLSTHTPPIVIELLSLEAVRQCEALLGQYGYKKIAECEGCNFVFCTPEKETLLRHSYEATRGFGSNKFKLDQMVSITV
jgi:FkbM family methyltransferase